VAFRANRLEAELSAVTVASLGGVATRQVRPALVLNCTPCELPGKPPPEYHAAHRSEAPTGIRYAVVTDDAEP
jgi:hypothetical protein